MNQERMLTPVAGIAVRELDNLESFKRGVDNLLSKRSYFISQVLPRLKEGQDFFTIKGKKCLAKGGSEKLASIYNLTASFERDEDTLIMFGHTKGLVAYVCNLKNRQGELVGQGRGADSLEMNENNPNKTLKMAQKRAYIDAVIRATGLSDIFTQDIADGPTYDPQPVHEQAQWIDAVVEDEEVRRKPISSFSSSITEPQRKYLVSLINSRVLDEDDRERRLEDLNGLTRQEASQWIKEFCRT